MEKLIAAALFVMFALLTLFLNNVFVEIENYFFLHRKVEDLEDLKTRVKKDGVWLINQGRKNDYERLLSELYKVRINHISQYRSAVMWVQEIEKDSERIRIFWFWLQKKNKKIKKTTT